MAKAKAKKTTRPATRGAAKKKTPAAAKATDGKLDEETLAGEMRQLTAIRRLFPVLDDATAAALLSSHEADACRERGTATRSADTFRGAMTWARTFGENVDDPAVDSASIRVRWFLDCLNALGSAIAGNAVSDDPVAEGRYQDIATDAERLLARSARRARDAAGTLKGRLDAIDAALAHDGVGDPLVSRLRKLARLLDDWRSSSTSDAPLLSAYGVTAQTVYRLRDAAQALEDAIANRPAPKQVDRDTPVINTLEGRLYYVMRSLWDDLADARDDGTTSLQLPVSPTLLRGLEIHNRRKTAASPTPAAPTPS
ncbi:MAG: hypothetical protein IT379_32765 [Deltaproteobacteria bacterium]|nr:hypothetical protein [Deltaproteobacteria bacterium]